MFYLGKDIHQANKKPTAEEKNDIQLNQKLEHSKTVQYQFQPNKKQSILSSHWNLYKTMEKYLLNSNTIINDSIIDPMIDSADILDDFLFDESWDSSENIMDNDIEHDNQTAKIISQDLLGNIIELEEKEIPEIWNDIEQDLDDIHVKNEGNPPQCKKTYYLQEFQQRLKSKKSDLYLMYSRRRSQKKCYSISNSSIYEQSTDVWKIGCEYSNIECVGNSKNVFLSLEVMNKFNPNHNLWNEKFVSFYFDETLKLLLSMDMGNETDSGLVHNLYHVFQLRNRIQNEINDQSQKYLQNFITDDKIIEIGALHITLKYLCCYLENDLLEIIRLLKDFHWPPFNIYLSHMICLKNEYKNEYYLPFIFDKVSQVKLQNWTFTFEVYLNHNNVEVKQCRKDFQPFNIPFAYFYGSLDGNLDDILFLQFVNKVNERLLLFQSRIKKLHSPHKFVIRFDKRLIERYLCIVARGDNKFNFNAKSFQCLL